MYFTDGDQSTASKDLVQVPIGPVTRARAKKFKDVLNGLIQELWAQANSWRPIEHDPCGQQKNHHLDSSSRRIWAKNWYEIFWVYVKNVILGLGDLFPCF